VRLKKYERTERFFFVEIKGIGSYVTIIIIHKKGLASVILEYKKFWKRSSNKVRATFFVGRKKYKKERTDKLNQLVENESSKLDRLIDNYLDETIDVTMYDMFQKKLSSRIEKYKIEINELGKKFNSLEPLEVRIENVKKSNRRLLDINYNGVNEKVIEKFVEKIIVHNDYFEWKLNFMNETIKLEIIGKSKSDCLISEYIN